MQAEANAATMAQTTTQTTVPIENEIEVVTDYIPPPQSPLLASQIGSSANKAEPEPLENDGSCGDKACNKVGICFQGSCFCDKYHAGEACDKDLAHPGVKGATSFIFYGVALFLGLITGGFVAKIYNENNKKLFL